MRTNLDRQIATALGAEDSDVKSGAEGGRSLHEVKREIYRKLCARFAGKDRPTPDSASPPATPLEEKRGQEGQET